MPAYTHEDYYNLHPFDKMKCYSYDDVNGKSYFVYFFSGKREEGCKLLSLRDWGNYPIAKFTVKKWKN